MVRVYVYEKTRTVRNQVILSYDDTLALYRLVTQWQNSWESSNNQDLPILQQRLITALENYKLISTNAVPSVFIVPERVQDQIPRGGANPIPDERGTVLRCSISGNGSGVLLPTFLLPRPRLATIWIASSGTTFAVNKDTQAGYSAIGAHVGLALGFIGIGIFFRTPGVSHYVVVGYALWALLSGDNVMTFPSSK
jgi:hypothetical protein